MKINKFLAFTLAIDEYSVEGIDVQNAHKPAEGIAPQRLQYPQPPQLQFPIIPSKDPPKSHQICNPGKYCWYDIECGTGGTCIFMEFGQTSSHKVCSCAPLPGTEPPIVVDPPLPGCKTDQNCSPGWSCSTCW